MNSRKLEFFPESRIRLSQEVKNHPELMDRLKYHPQDEFEVLLAEIASYCEVIMHGDYFQEDIDKLCEILYEKLRDKRGAIILLNPH